ncbi:hypothetical protein HAX54_033588 [Datura stramonium]|uniref:RING-type E3 ubiquitin transferase n=1 Tax=Datura stramonium TaxID=4076 RepID=A0ABS8VFA8_DATST|nr:hypothetical protein [Datura stramonium]
MNELPLSLMLSEYLSTGNLLEALIHISKEVFSMEKLPFVQTKNISTTVKLLRKLQKRALWSLMQTESISNQFHALTKEMEKALDILPLRLLNVTVDTKEQAKRADLFIDPREIQRREEILQLMATNCDRKSKNKGPIDFDRVKQIFNSIGLTISLDYEDEILKLEAQAEKQQARVSHCSLEYQQPNILDLLVKNCNFGRRTLDPVIVVSGILMIEIQSLSDKFRALTCPKSGQRLIHMALIPNYALKSLIQQWCQENNIPITEPTLTPSDSESSSTEFLVGKLATGSQDIQRQAAYELRLLAKFGMENRRIIAESGAIPFLITLLGSRDPRIQENAVIIGAHTKAIPALVGFLEDGTTAGKRDAAVALFNLAVYDANRQRIVLAGAVPLLIDLLMDDKAGITDDSLAVLALVLGCNEGLQALRKERILVPLLLD